MGAMTDHGSWFHRFEGHVEDDLRRAAAVFHHHASTIADEASLSDHPGAVIMTLLDLSNTIKSIAEAAEAPLRTLLDEHVPALVSLGQQVENSKIIQGAIRAEESLPPAIKDSIAALLAATVDQFESAPAAAPVEAAPEPAAA
jgi:hypothetical protein